MHEKVLLPVPLSPTTCQTSVTVTLDFGITMVRSSGLPSGPGRRLPSRSTMTQWPPTQLACMMPLAKLQVPVTR